MAFSTRFESACSVRPASAIAPRSGLDPALQVDAVELGLWRVSGHSVVRYRAEIDGAERDAERAAAQAGEIEEVANQALEPVRLTLDHLAGVLRCHDAVAEALGVTADGGQRRLQLVADREQERSFRVLGMPELLRELVERRGELTELRRALDGERSRGFDRRRAACSPRRPGSPGAQRPGRAETRHRRRGRARGRRRAPARRGTVSSRPTDCAPSGAGRWRRRRRGVRRRGTAPRAPRRCRSRDRSIGGASSRRQGGGARPVRG